MPDTTSSKIRLVAVTRKPDSGSFEQRVVNFIEPLAERGIDVTQRVVPRGVIAQRRFVRELSQFDGVWWHRHLLMIWNVSPLRRAAGCLVFDFDDPVTMSAKRNRPTFSRRVRFAKLLGACDGALVGSESLAGLARPHCPNTMIMPMAIDRSADATADRDASGPLELLWLGSRATQPYLEQIRPALERIGAQRNDVRLRLVAHEPMTFGSLDVDFQPWSPDAQERALRTCHIGLCPMPDTPWTRGKCPYKVLQYMAYGVSWVGSAVGQNVTTAGDRDTQRGLCASDDVQWCAAINQLLDDASLRGRMGERGIDYIAANHDRQAIADRLAAFWRQMVR